MPAYSGKFEYLDSKGVVSSQGACELGFDNKVCTVTSQAGVPITFDLGDVDKVISGDWDLTLHLYTEYKLQLKQFGAAFDRMKGELLSAWRERVLRCLLLEDLEEIDRFDGSAAFNGKPGSPAEIRLFKSNLAVLPANTAPAQWRLAEVERFQFDNGTYQASFRSFDEEEIVVSRLAKRTDEFVAKTNAALTDLSTKASLALHAEFPFLNPEQLAKLQRTVPEGRSAKISRLREIHPKLVDTWSARCVDDRLRPYFDELQKLAVEESIMTGYKFTAMTEDEQNGDAVEEPDAQQLFFWFFFPLRDRNIVAWEASTGTGRATYLFRLDRESPIEQQIARLTRGLALINFRREPIYLPDESLGATPKFHRYSIAARKLPELRMLRAAYMGRAIHATLESWRSQLPI